MSTKPVIVVAEFFGLYLHARTCLKNSKKYFLSWIYFNQNSTIFKDQIYHARGPVIRPIGFLQSNQNPDKYRLLVRIAFGCVNATIVYNISKATIHGTPIATLVAEFLWTIH